MWQQFRVIIVGLRGEGVVKVVQLLYSVCFGVDDLAIFLGCKISAGSYSI